MGSNPESDSWTDLLPTVGRAVVAGFGTTQQSFKPESLPNVVCACNCSIQEDKTEGAWAHIEF